MSPALIQRVVVLNYSIDAQAGRLANVQRVTLTRSGEGWRQEGGTTIPAAKIQNMIAALCSIHVAGVRPKPKELAEQLRGGKPLEMTLDVMMSLRQRGFMVTGEGRLLSSEGEVVVETTAGTNVTVRFGDVASSSTEGKADPKSAQENRFVFATSTDPALRGKLADWYYVLTGADVERLHPLRAAAAAK